MKSFPIGNLDCVSNCNYEDEVFNVISKKLSKKIKVAAEFAGPNPGYQTFLLAPIVSDMDVYGKNNTDKVFFPALHDVGGVQIDKILSLNL